MNLESKREGLTLGEDSLNLVDQNGSPVGNGNAVDNVVEISSIEQSKLVAAITPTEVAQEAARKQLPVYQGEYIDCFV